MSENYRIVEFDIIGPDEFGSLKIVLKVRLFRSDLFFGVFPGVAP